MIIMMRALVLFLMGGIFFYFLPKYKKNSDGASQERLHTGECTF